MDYRRIYFRECPEEIPEKEFEYQVNFIMGEGSISYVNCDGGRTTRGVKMNKEKLNHIKLILDKGKPEQYKDGLEVEESFLNMDGCTWQLVIDYSDGKSQLQINNHDEDLLGISKQYKVPAFVIELKKFMISNLGLEDFIKLNCYNY